MQNKLTIDAVESAKIESPKDKIIQIEVGGNTYHVRVKQYVLTKEKTKFIESMSNLVMSIKEKESDHFNDILLTYGLLSTMTDLELPQEIEPFSRYLLKLVDLNILDRIIGAINKEDVQELADYAAAFTHLVPSFFAQEPETESTTVE